MWSDWATDGAWDRRWNDSLFSRLSAGMRRHRTWEESYATVGFQARDLWSWGAGADVEWLLHPTISLAGRYRFEQRSLEEDEEHPWIWPEESWAEHRGTLELRWIHPTGWRVLVRETAVLQKGDLGILGGEQDAFWTDIVVEKYLFGRVGLVRFAAENAFDQPFRLKTKELVPERGRPARRIMGSIRINF